MNPYIAAKNALTFVMEAKPKDSLLVICDASLRDVAEAFGGGAEKLGMKWNILSLDDSGIRKELPELVRETISKEQPDIFINIMRGMAEETPFRIQLINLEKAGKKRLGHCPGLKLDMFVEGALALSEKDYQEMYYLSQKIMELAEGTERVELKNPSGTNVTFSVEGRDFFTDVKIDWKTMKWMNLPVGEVMVGPVEDSMNGEIVCTKAVGGIGLLPEPVRLHVKDGKVVDIKGRRDVTERIMAMLTIDEMASHIGEFAFGINPKARVVSEFLETEKVFGTVHVAFGNNEDYPGGRNTSKNHMDFLIEEPTVTLFKGGQSRVVLRKGTFIL